MPSFPSLSESLHGAVARLRTAAERDIPEVLIAHQDDPGLHLALGERRPPSGAELGRRAERSELDRAAGTRVWLTITQRDDDECCGQLGVEELDWLQRRCRLHVWVAPRLRGRGLARDALALAARWLLRDCGLERVQLLCEPGNGPALAAARAAGFTPEGVLRAYERRGRQRVDLTVMAIVAADLDPGAGREHAQASTAADLP